MLSFIQQFVLSPRRTGAIYQSSSKLADAITDYANLDSVSSVIELGSGTGVFTEKIQSKINHNTDFAVIELNPIFASQTKKICPTVTVYNDCASNIEKILSVRRLDSCDVIISGLPWTLFESGEQEKLIKIIQKSLSNGGSFLTFSYAHGQVFSSARRFRRVLEKHFFSMQTTPVVWRNVPPAFIYICEK